MDKKIYTKEEIDILLQKYKKTKSQEYLTGIFNAFSGFIIKYANLLKYNYFQAKDKDIHNLLKMISNKDSLNGLDTIKIVFRNYSYDDILGELNLLFLRCINKFVRQPNGPYFVGYLYSYFKFDVRDWIRKISFDIFNTLKIEFTDKYNNITEEPCQQDEFENLCLSDKTILTNLEKYILYLSYGKKLCDKEISKIIGIPYKSCNNMKQKARKKLINSGITLDDFKI